MALPRQLTSRYNLVHYAVLGFFFLWLYPFYLRPKAIEIRVGRSRVAKLGLSSYRGELEVTGVIFAAFMYKLKKKAPSFDKVVQRSFLHAKVLSLVFAFMSGDQIALIATFAVYGIMLVLLVPPKGASDNVIEITDETFKQTIKEAYDPEMSHIVFFANPFNAENHYFESTFAALSTKYVHTKLQYSTVDLTKYVELAKEHDIDPKQKKDTPCVILFFRGKEVSRLSRKEKDGKEEVLSEEAVVKNFELNLDDPSKATYRKDAKPERKKNKSKRKKS